MASTPTLGDEIEQMALRRVLTHIHEQKQRGRHSVELAALAEATGIDPTTVERAMRCLEAGGPYTVERAHTSVSTVRWNIRGSVYDLGGWAAVDDDRS